MIYGLIIFDCDGTLVDSEALNNQAMLDLIKSFGIHDYDMDYALTHFMGLRFGKIAEMIAAQTGFTFPEDAPARYRARVRELTTAHLSPIAGAADMVREAARQAKICVASNGERGNVLFSLQKVGLLDFFTEQRVFTGLMVENPKPAPDLFLLAAKTLGESPENALVIEDSPAGVQAGLSAGMQVWGFCGAHHAPEKHAQKLEKSGAHAVHLCMDDLRADIAALICRPNVLSSRW